jgi:hypothetical protein
VKCDLFSSCAACEPKANGLVKWMMDSGASMAFTSNTEDYSQLTYFEKDAQMKVSTANGFASIIGHGTIFIETKPHGETVITRLHPVFLLPGIKERLLSMGQILHGNLCINGDQNTLTFAHAESGNVVLHANNSDFLHPNIYWVDTHIVNGSDLTALSSIHEESYDLWHRRLGHPSDQVLVKFKSKTKNFPSDLRILKESPICEGCVKGKMHNRSFLENPLHTAKPFEQIHSDLREYPILSYGKYKYYISFLDDCTSATWIMLLWKKSNAYQATEEFLIMIHTQYGIKVLEWFSDDGGEYVSKKYVELLKSHGILIYHTVPKQKSMNGWAE